MSKEVLKRIISSIICITVIIVSFSINIIAVDQIVLLDGIIYGFNDSLKYDINESQFRTNTAAGILKISGNIDSKETAEVPKYLIRDGLISVTYSANQTYKSNSEDEWHFVDDNSKEVNGVTLPEEIKKGAIFVQTSFDRKKWGTIKDTIKTNIFDAENQLPTPLYTTNDLQLINGCYYRIVVAYKVTKKSDTKEWYQFSNPDLYKFYTEIYEFYASYEEKDTNEGESYYLGKTEAVIVEDGFSTGKDMKKNDPHLGWDLGQFELKGFTKYNGDNIFLKKVGDEILLQFKLNSDIDIDSLNGKSDLIINDISEGYDRLLNVAPQYFGRGTFILRKTDYRGVTQDPPILHQNFLESLAYPGKDMKIMLLEEGDYEVTLDYEIKDNGNWGKLYDYRITCKFKIRNGNTEVYPKDITERDGDSYLSDNSFTPNGFILDWAKSRYLKTNIHAFYWGPSTKTTYKSREIKNEAAKESEEYTKPGVYTITVTNPTTDPYEKHPTTMRIYVGDDPVIKAAIKGEYASKPLDVAITDILKLQIEGWTIDEYGNMIEPPQTTTSEKTLPETSVSTTVSSLATTTPPASETTVSSEMAVEVINTNEAVTLDTSDPSTTTNSANILPIFIVVAIIIISAGILVAIFIFRKRKNNKEP